MDNIPASQEVIKHILSISDDTISHHGVLGMKWGHRNSEPTKVVSKTGSRGGKATIKTSGGENKPAHGDAIAARKVEQQLKKSGSHSLSNAQLKKYADRKDLETRVSRLTETPSHYDRAIKGAAKVQAFMRTPEGKTSMSLLKRAAKSKTARRTAAKVAVNVASVVA